MKKIYKITIGVLIVVSVVIVAALTPFLSLTVVPEWELIFKNKNGSPAPLRCLDQRWQNYSFEWSFGEISEESVAEKLQTDSNGYVKLSARNIRVSIFDLILAQIRNQVMSTNTHASFGSSSYIVCGDGKSCLVSYEDGTERPQNVIVGGD